MSDKTHWKKLFDPNWIGCYVLPDGADIVVKLISVEFKKQIKVSGKMQDRPVATFEKNQYFDKPMILNKTNCKRLEIRTGLPHIEDWKNLNIFVTLGQEMDKTVTGGQDWALRIKSKAPVLVLPTLEIGSQNFKGCKTALASGYTVEDFKKKYQITAEVEKALLSKDNEKI